MAARLDGLVLERLADRRLVDLDARRDEIADASRGCSTCSTAPSTCAPATSVRTTPTTCSPSRPPSSTTRRPTAPLWNACLERWQPDPEIRSFLQRACGTAITGHPLENLFVNHGAGSNGKTKFFEAIKHVLGDYAVTPSKGLFVMTKHEDHKTELASLFGARMLVLPETAQAGRLNED